MEATVARLQRRNAGQHDAGRHDDGDECTDDGGGTHAGSFASRVRERHLSNPDLDSARRRPGRPRSRARLQQSRQQWRDGLGWSLSALAVTRCNRTIAQDGVPAAVANTLADRYCLDSQQLKLVSGSYGMPGSVYATEIESFSRIIANGSAGNGPASFTVTSKNGLVYEYGTTADSQVFAGTTGPSAPGRSRESETVPRHERQQHRDRLRQRAQNGAYTSGTCRVESITYPATATGRDRSIVFRSITRPACR